MGVTLVAGLLAVAPVVDAAAGETTFVAGALTITVSHEPFALSVVQGGVAVLETEPRSGLPLLSPDGPLSFAVGARVGVQVPLASYGVFAEVPLVWHHATVAEPQPDGSFLVRTTDPRRNFDLQVHALPDGTVEVAATLDDTSGVLATGATFASDERQRFLGFGERSDAVDQTGRVVEQWNEEGPFSAGALRPLTEPLLGETWQGPPPVGPASNYTMPWFVSSRGYGFLLDSTWLNRFDLTAQGRWRVETAEPALRYRVYAGPAPADVLARATADAVLGRQPPPAEWFFGPWYQPTGDDTFRNALIEAWRTPVAEGGLDVPVTVSQTYTHYLPCAGQAGSRATGGQRALTDRYHAWGYRVTTYVNSFVCQTHPDGAYATADASGWFVRTPLGPTYPIPYIAYTSASSAVVDFTAPGAGDFWRSLISEALDDGYDGWMEDFGEYVPPDAVVADGRTGLAAHNDYCTDYHRASHELTWPARGEDFAQFVRCGYTGTAPYARIVWGGDPTEDDSEADGLAAAVNQGLAIGLSGIGYWGSDIGGFHSLFTEERTSPELLVRWLEVGAFSGIMRTQAEGYERPGQGGHRAEVWDPDVVGHWRALARLRTQLFPYVWAAAQEYQSSGLPIMRHLALAYPDEEAPWGLGDPVAAAAAQFEWLFGPDLLVAPVVDMGVTGRDVWLPPGQWVDVWDAVVYDEVTGSYDADPAGSAVLEGGRVVRVESPLGRPPLFARAGTCLPLLPADVDTLDDTAGFAHDDRVVTLAEGIDRVRTIAFAASC